MKLRQKSICCVFGALDSIYRYLYVGLGFQLRPHWITSASAIISKTSFALALKICKYMHMERDSKKIVRRLLNEGFELINIAGSHHKFRKGAVTVIVPHPKKDLPTGTARAIAKQAGWKTGH
jgi:predicted RNA binding protein YcfA (HicA-like mRNA interferase family)